MENLFKNNRFYPQNFFIRKNSNTDIEAVVNEIAEKAAFISEESFNSETKSFIYKLEYEPPYVKAREFAGIRNLQNEAMSKIRFKAEYDGYIGIDISEWIGHTDEDHFINCIGALQIMSSHWKYVLFVDEHCNEIDVNKTVDFIKLNGIWLQELSPDDFTKHKTAEEFKQCLKDYNIKLSVSAQGVIQNVFSDSELDTAAVSGIAHDASQYFRNTKIILAADLMGYLSAENTYAHFIMSEDEKNRLNDLIYKEGKR